MTREELEKEAEEYALNTYEMCSYSDLPYASDRRAREQAYIAAAEPREKRIKELEKENTELKKKNLDTQDAVTMQMYTNRANKEIADKQLTKAKEIIKLLLWDLRNRSYEPVKDVEQAEQFLKETE